MQKDKPVYPISIAAELLEVHPRTIRLYEKYGLIHPRRRGNKRFFSNNDLRWVRCIREMIHEKGLNIEGIRRLLCFLPCWQIKGCTEKEREACSAYYDKTEPCWKLAEKICPEKFEMCKECSIYQEQKGETTKPKQISSSDHQP